VHTRALVAGLQQALAAQLGENGVRVHDAYLYSEPGLAAGLAQLQAAGATRLVVLPHYPQCSGTTTGAVFDQLGASFRRWRALPDCRVIGDYHIDAGYLGALAASVRARWQEQGRTTHLLMSFHGLPVRCVQRGDPYERQCHATAQALATTLGLGAGDWTISFQSRFGSQQWLAPATDATLAALPARGVRDLTVICPGFAVDCLETLEEIAIGGQEVFRHAGGEQFGYVPALNGRGDHAAALARLVLEAPGAQLPGVASGA
jgi:ferrochelatase